MNSIDCQSPEEFLAKLQSSLEDSPVEEVVAGLHDFCQRRGDCDPTLYPMLLKLIVQKLYLRLLKNG